MRRLRADRRFGRKIGDLAQLRRSIEQTWGRAVAIREPAPALDIGRPRGGGVLERGEILLRVRGYEESECQETAEEGRDHRRTRGRV